MDIRILNRKAFEKYGYVIEYDRENGHSFQVILSEYNPVGWRIAVSKITGKSTSKMARHPGTMESFEPLDGITLLCVAPFENPEDVEFFLLEKPVCIYRNIWHATLCLSEYSIVKITENCIVDSEEYLFAREFSPVVQEIHNSMLRETDENE